MAEEMRLHVEQRIEQYVRAGLPPHEARAAARRAFGAVAWIQDECRRQQGTSWFDDLSQQARHGLRQLSRSPGVVAVAVLTLGVGIGVNTVVAANQGVRGATGTWRGFGTR